MNGMSEIYMAELGMEGYFHATMSFFFLHFQKIKIKIISNSFFIVFKDISASISIVLFSSIYIYFQFNKKNEILKKLQK